MRAMPAAMWGQEMWRSCCQNMAQSKWTRSRLAKTMRARMSRTASQRMPLRLFMGLGLLRGLGLVRSQ